MFGLADDETAGGNDKLCETGLSYGDTCKLSDGGSYTTNGVDDSTTMLVKKIDSAKTCYAKLGTKSADFDSPLYDSTEINLLAQQSATNCICTNNDQGYCVTWGRETTRSLHKHYRDTISPKLTLCHSDLRYSP
jgi:hypothetical protein